MRCERGQVSVEYAITAAMFALVMAMVIGLFQRGLLIGWMEAVKRTVFVPVESLSDAKAVGRELADR